LIYLFRKLFGKGKSGAMLYTSKEFPFDNRQTLIESVIRPNIPCTKTSVADSRKETNKAMTANIEAQANATMEAERKRIAEIDEIAALYDPETVYKAKYGKNACTAAEMAFMAAKKAANQGQKFLSTLMDEYKCSGAAEVGTSYIPEDDSIPLTPEQRIAQGSAYVKKVQKSKPTQGGS